MLQIITFWLLSGFAKLIGIEIAQRTPAQAFQCFALNFCSFSSLCMSFFRYCMRATSSQKTILSFAISHKQKNFIKGISTLNLICHYVKTAYLRRFFFIRIHVPRTYDPGFRFFVKQMFKQEGKKVEQNVPSSLFPAKMGLNSGEPSTHTAHALPCLHTQ